MDEQDISDYDGIYHFSVSLGEHNPTQDIPSLLRHFAKSLEAHEYKDVLDIILETADISSDNMPSLTVYYTKEEESIDEA